MSVTGRVDFTGIENAGLDFSQLEDYINDEEDPNESIYFSDNLVTSDLKLPDSPRSAGKVSEGQLSLGQGRLFSQSNGPAVHHDRVSSVTLSVNGASNRSSIQINQTIANNNSETNNVHHLSSTLNANHSHQHHQQQHQQQIIHHHQQPIGHHQPSAHHQQTISLYDNKSHHHPHHLPESPPDSGSEPPYSPPNDDSNRIINNQGNLGTTSSSTTSSTSITNQQSHATSGEMLQTGSVDNLKHFSHYSNNQLKQLAPNELGLPVPPSHLHLPRNNNLVHLNALHGLNGPIPGHPDDGLLVHHLGPSVLNGPINLQSPSMLPGLSPASSGGHPPHLTSLYTPNDEQYIGPNSVSDCGPEGQGQGPNGSQQQQQTKKRKMSESPKNVPNSALVNGNIVHIKQEPGGMSPEPGIGPNGGSIMVSMEDEYGFDYNASTEGPPSVYLDSAYQCIRFQTFQQTAWHTLCDASLKELPVPNYRVDADKGFNFSNADDAFVCQKKNHFQVTVHVQPIGDPHFVKTAECVKKVDNFYLHFYGVKVESPSQTIKIEQSQSDRSKKPFHPVLIELNPEQVSKTTVGRLHFSETTSNNMRKKGKPNPDQRYFYLVVSLCAHVGDQSYPIVSHASERIIVRASNPGQFENDMELSWQKGHTPESIYHAGRVGINTDRPDEPLVVHGNVKVTGHIIQPSDRRAKTNIEEISTREQLKNVSNIRVVRYQFTPEFAQQVGLKEEDINGTGIIAQEVRQILPDAVKETGDVILPTGERIEKLLVVNKERIFMENVGAVKELCKVTDNLETRIDELERMNKKLRRINRFDSIKSILSSSSVASASTVTCISNYSVGQNGKRFSHKLPHAYEPHGRKCSKHSNPEDNQVCTNRFMQSIIMILVFIMAFCLASIVALYILDYPRRHANDLAPSAHHNFDHQFSQQQHTQFVNKSQPSFQHSPSSSSISTLFTESPYSSSSLSSATASMLTKSQSTMNSRPRSDLDRGYTKSDTQYSVDSSAHNVGWSSTSSDQRPTSLPILRPRILGEPSRCSSLRSKVECPIHCCLELKHESESLYNHNLSKTKQSSSSSDDEKIKLDSSEDKSDLTKESEVKIKEPPKDENNSESQHKDVATASTLTASSSTPIATTTISTIKTNYVSLTSSTTQASNSPLGQRSNGVTVPLKLTAINNHVSEEVSSRVAHGRYNVDSSSSSASSSPESASHINNLAADSSPNYTVSGSNNSSNQPIDPIDQAINSKVALSDSFVANNKFAGYNNHHSQSSSSGMIYSKAEDYREKREARDSKSDVVSSQTAGELLVKRARAASESSRLPGSLIESMRLIELNATIGREFCTTWQCVQQSGSLLSYLVPLSKYMSLEYVTFQFSLSTALKVDNCEYKERPSPCRSSDLVPHTYHRPSEHEPIEEINPSFGIPIGLYARSTYVFRILSKDKNIDTPCSLPESELGSSYLEIELTFYRVCDK